MAFSPRAFPFAIVMTMALVLAAARAATADEIWVTPTYQQDTGGVGAASHVLWPVTQAGVVRLTLAVPNDLQTFESAKVVVIPHAPGGASNLHVLICPAQSGDIVSAACAGPFVRAFAGVPDQLQEIDISSIVASRIGTPGATYLSVVAYTTPNTATDHFVGLRFVYSSEEAQ